MIAGEFLYKNSDSSDPFYRQNMVYGICRHCERNSTCSKSERYPIISPMAQYVIKYYAEIEGWFEYYPNDGGWENQPQWFLSLLSTYRAVITKQQKREIDGNNSK